MSKMRASQNSVDLLDSGRLFIWGEIDDELALPLIQSLKCLVAKGYENIYLYISSDGGECDSEFAIIDEISLTKEAGINVYTIAQGRACSAAADILSLGTPGCRFATPSSCVMLHPTSYDLAQDSIETHKRTSDFIAKQYELICETIAEACGKHTKLKYRKFKEDIQHSKWMNAQEAIKFGVIDGVWTLEKEQEITSTES